MEQAVSEEASTSATKGSPEKVEISSQPCQKENEKSGNEARVAEKNEKQDNKKQSKSCTIL